MLKLSRLRALSIGAAVAIAASATATLAQDVLKFGHVYEASTPYHAAALRAAELLEEATGGRYKMEVFPASQLGKEAALNEALSLGTVDVIYTGVAFLGQSYGPISISDYPFTMRSYEHWKAYVNSDLFDEMSEAYNKVSGNTVAAMTYYGARHVTANKPILSPKDMEGLKIRTPNAPAYQMFPRATGANPTPMAFARCISPCSRVWSTRRRIHSRRSSSRSSTSPVEHQSDRAHHKLAGDGRIACDDEQDG